MTVIWTPALIAELTRLHAQVPVLSFLDIAKRLQAHGHKVTRNGCIGKARRLGLPPRDPVVISAANTRRLREYNSNRARLEPMPIVKGKAPSVVPVYTEPRGLTLIELEFGECKWPLNDGGPFRFCGCAQHPGRPYCLNHTKLAYHPVGRVRA